MKPEGISGRKSGIILKTELMSLHQAVRRTLYNSIEEQMNLRGFTNLEVNQEDENSDRLAGFYNILKR
jgi:hypothetical protein